MRSLLFSTFSNAFFRGSRTRTFVDIWPQQVVHPSCPSSFFQGGVQVSTLSLYRLGDRDVLGFEDGFQHQLARGIQDRNRDHFLVNFHPHILRALYKKGAPFWRN